MRLDKYLKVSRLIKRRTVANEACDAGRVLVNDKPAKASVQVKTGDTVEIQFGSRNVKVSVTRHCCPFFRIPPGRNFAWLICFFVRPACVRRKRETGAGTAVFGI